MRISDWSSDVCSSDLMKGTYFLTQKVARTMVDAGRPGKIVNIASTAAFKPDFQLAAYNAAKAGVVSLTRSLCTELAPYRILVNTVVPGPIRTTNTEPIYADPAIQKMIAQRVPLGAPGEPDDIGNAIGRASCWEKGWQYVYFSVVGVAL